MALDATKLELVRSGYNNLWFYTTTDTVATVTGSGYFNSVYQYFRQYDRIMVVGTTGGTPTIDNVFISSATGATTVTSSAVEGVTAT